MLDNVMVGPLGLCRRKRGGGRLRGRGGRWGWGLERRGVATEGNTGIMNKIYGMRGKEVETNDFTEDPCE